MQRLDRYIFSELLRAVAGGLALFAALVICVYQLQGFLKLLLREDYPAGAALKSFLYGLPQNVGWVLPVAVIFGTITAVGRMSSDGELIAMHAGGVSFRRMLLPVALVGGIGVGVLYIDTEVLAPRALAAAADLVWEYGSKARPVIGFDYTGREGDRVSAHIFASVLDPRTRVLTGVVFAQIKENQPEVVVVARSARWEGEWLNLEDVQTWQMTPKGAILAQAAKASYEVGAFPLEVERRPEAMTIPQMRAWVAELRGMKAPVGRAIRPFEQAIAVRWATPWCALGFALVSAPLGIRRVRSSTGVNMGLSLIVFVPYYFVSYTLQVLNKHGGIHPLIPAWAAIAMLFIVAAGLILDKSR
ncbi:MAG: YjgP/YjgQ family permease [Armatimonadetes bacterium]|nr:YjgP/YjgQ family permease [Armatimonadota bacterium]